MAAWRAMMLTMNGMHERVAEALRMTQALLTSVDAGELSCSAAMRHRIEGAVLALDTLTAPSGE